MKQDLHAEHRKARIGASTTATSQIKSARLAGRRKFETAASPLSDPDEASEKDSKIPRVKVVKKEPETTTVLTTKAASKYDGPTFLMRKRNEQPRYHMKREKKNQNLRKR